MHRPVWCGHFYQLRLPLPKCSSLSWVNIKLASIICKTGSLRSVWSCVPESLRIPRHISDLFLGVWSCPFVCLDHLRIPRPIFRSIPCCECFCHIGNNHYYCTSEARRLGGNWTMNTLPYQSNTFALAMYKRVICHKNPTVEMSSLALLRPWYLVSGLREDTTMEESPLLLLLFDRGPPSVWNYELNKPCSLQIIKSVELSDSNT